LLRAFAARWAGRDTANGFFSVPRCVCPLSCGFHKIHRYSRGIWDFRGFDHDDAYVPAPLEEPTIGEAALVAGKVGDTNEETVHEDGNE
jgi:hypothetical protein